MVEQINFNLYPRTFSNVRHALLPLSQLKKFIEWQKGKIKSSQDANFADITKEDSDLRATLKDLLPLYSKANLDLISALKNILIKSNDFNEKVVVIKSLFSIDKGDELVNEFLVPSLEKRPDFENTESNNKFSIQFLSMLDIEKLRDIFNLVNYRKINNTQQFVQSIIEIKDSDLILDVLMLNPLHDTTIEDSDTKALNNKIKLQKITLMVMHILEARLYTIPAVYLEQMYKAAASDDICTEVSKLLFRYYQSDASRLFKSLLDDNIDQNDKHRRNKFSAIAHYAASTKEYAAPSLKEFLMKETDPFLIGHTCYVLANTCGLDGKRALIETIVKQIRNKELSIPLAYLTQMTKFGSPYNGIIKNIFCRNYPEGNDLKDAYLKLQAATLGAVVKQINGTMVFYPSTDYMPELVVDLVNNLGMPAFLKWASVGEGRTPDIQKIVKKNASDLLELAWDTNRARMEQIFLEALSTVDNSYINLSKSLVGMGNYDSNKLKVS